MGDEDEEKSSNAGRYKSVMCVKKEELIGKIEYVMRSAGTCKRKAVLVQEMVISEVAGVIFTQNPIYKSNEMIINACLGAGENVVSSIMEADTYEISQERINVYPAERRIAFTYGIDSLPGEHLWLNGIEVRTLISNDYKTIHSVFYESIRVPVLRENQLKNLYQIANYLRKVFQEELDIEFAIEKGLIYILQVRSITTVSQLEKENLETKKKGIMGQIVSSGVFSGEAIYVDISNLDDDTLLEKCMGKVLVVQEMTPDLLYFVNGVGAIITSKGGVLSHGAIWAREKRIPCISGIGDGILKIKTGMLVKVNADKGEILIGENNS